MFGCSLLLCFLDPGIQKIYSIDTAVTSFVIAGISGNIQELICEKLMY